MARKGPYIPARTEREIKVKYCNRAVRYLNSLGKDLSEDPDHEKFSTIWDAYLELGLPVTCRASRKAGKKVGVCDCGLLPPRKKGGKRK